MMKTDIFESDDVKLKDLRFDSSQFIIPSDVYAVQARKKYEYRKINSENVKTDILLGYNVVVYDSDLVRVAIEKGKTLSGLKPITIFVHKLEGDISDIDNLIEHGTPLFFKVKNLIAFPKWKVTGKDDKGYSKGHYEGIRFEADVFQAMKE